MEHINIFGDPVAKFSFYYLQIETFIHVDLVLELIEFDCVDLLYLLMQNNFDW